jgi:hypothetical protein
MNEARINVGMHAVATASVAYHESLEYARTRPQGRAPGAKPTEAQVPILVHSDVRRMLLRQKAIVEGGLLLVLLTSKYQDIAHHGATAEERERAAQLVDILTPIAKTFPAEKGFESNALAVQIHGGYGYTSEYLPEAWLRDQKLNSIHEGTTGIQSNDLLGRKVIKGQGAALALLRQEIEHAIETAIEAGVDPEDCAQLQASTEMVLLVSNELTTIGSKTFERALRHSTDYMDMLSTLVIGWMWLLQATRSVQAQYWFRTEVPRIVQLAALCMSQEDSFARMQDDWW